ncbi:hypothetical protein ACF9IK_35110 [Kitasatospora hibisci]|uniref:hypothetical protein n=1 Tax=Kitasatospora hibisci TaxID=3369522 RepID=UPI003754876F
MALNPRTRSTRSVPERSHLVDGAVLLLLLVVSAGVYAMAGAAGLSAVAGASGGLFAAWRSRRN